MPKQTVLLNKDRIITYLNAPLLEDLKGGCMILLDKPLGWTSFDVVNKLRSSIKYATGIRKMKVGHAGTLDPMATGLLLICIGKYTKLIDQLTGHAKSYEAVMKLGATTASYDKELPEENFYEGEMPSIEDIHSVVDEFQGTLQQVPPIYSALKVDGKTAHKVARKGQYIELKPREIHLFTNEIVSIEYPYVTLNVMCSKGTYIRSLAHDIGKRLGTGAYLYGLRRTKVANYSINQSVSIEAAVSWLDRLPPQQESLG